MNETFTATHNCLAGCDANPDTSSHPEVESPENKGSITVDKFAPPGSPPNTPETQVVILTNGEEYEYDTPPPASDVFKPGTMGLNLPEGRPNALCTMACGTSFEHHDPPVLVASPTPSLQKY